MTNPSLQQLTIRDWFASGTSNILVRARAGCGKTSTIKWGIGCAPEKKMLFACFNKRNQREASEKIQDFRVDVKTLHSVGFRFIKQAWGGRIQPDDQIEFDRIDMVSDVVRNFPQERGELHRLVAFVKNTYVNPGYADIEAVAEERGIEYEHLDLPALALKVLDLSKQRDAEGKISFNDMVWLPVAAGMVRPIYELTAVDEAQDCSLPQLLMVRGASCGRIVVVGDDFQTIYGFRGTAPDGMNLMKATLRAAELPLTTTYRCPKSVVRLAQQIVPDYNAAPEAPEGEVIYGGNPNHAEVGDAILSRLNAPLMPLALSLIRNGVAARIEGKDIGRQLVAMTRSMKAKSVPHFIERIESWLTRQLKRLGAKKKAHAAMDQSRDIAATLQAAAMDCDSVADIERRITSLFSDSDENPKPAVTLSTVHKYKGLEADRVFILSDSFRPRESSDKQEEENIKYVAWTRAKQTLVFTGRDTAPEKRGCATTAEVLGL